MQRTCVGWPARSVRSLRYHGTVLYLADSAPNFTANRFLVASQSVRDLLLCAKYLFVAAMGGNCAAGAARDEQWDLPPH